MSVSLFALHAVRQLSCLSIQLGWLFDFFPHIRKYTNHCLDSVAGAIARELLLLASGNGVRGDVWSVVGLYFCI